MFGPIPTQTKGTRTLTVSVTNALWNESTQSQITVFLVAIAPTGTAVTNEYIRPRDFSITNTPLGTMTWNFPETVGEVTDWNTSLGYNYQQNATTSDYGYFFSYDPFVPNPKSSSIFTKPSAPSFSPILMLQMSLDFAMVSSVVSVPHPFSFQS